MIFTLKNYSDLGRCSYGTLRDFVDTEMDEIYLNGKKVDIKTVEDLFPFLWQNPGVGGHSCGGSTASFSHTGTHWHDDFDESIADAETKIEKYTKKISKNPDSHLVPKWKKEITYETDRKESLSRLVKNLDNEMEEQKKKLIEENSTNGK